MEAATGVDYGDIAAELVFHRAHLRASSSGQFPAGCAGIAFGDRHGDLIEVPEGFTEIPGTWDVWTTVGDLIVLSQALRAGVVVGETVAAQLWTPHVTIGRSGEVGPVDNDAYGYGTFLGQVKGQPARIPPG